MRTENEIKEKLEKEIETASWNMLLDHYQKGHIIWVAPDLDLIDVGVQIAKDNTEFIKSHMDEKKVLKPTKDQVDLWSKSPHEKHFHFIILQPYVVIQQNLN